VVEAAPRCAARGNQLQAVTSVLRARVIVRRPVSRVYDARLLHGGYLHDVFARHGVL
jgi:hypothetical protein